MKGRTSSIRRDFAVLGGSAVLVLMLLVAVSAFDGARREREAAEATLLRLSAIVADDVATYVQYAMTVLDEIVLRAESTLSGGGACTSWHEVLPFVPLLENAVVLGTDGVSACPQSSDGASDVGASYAHLPYFQRALASDSIIVSEIVRASQQADWTVALARSIVASDGSLRGVAVVSLRLANFDKLLHSQLLPSSSLVTITDRDGTILARSADSRRWVGTAAPSLSFDTRLVAGLNSTASMEGQEMLFGFRRIPSLGWHVFVGLPTREIIAPLRSRVIRGGLMALGGSFLILVFVGLSFRRVATPLGLLVEATRSALLGDVDHIEIRGPRELAEVALRFDDALRQRRALESRVAMLSQVAEQSADSVIVTDTGGLIEYVNPAFESLTGYVLAELRGKTPRVLKSGVHPREFYEDLWATVASGEPYRATVTNRKKGGDLFVVEKTISPLHDENGAITHYVSTDRDVTERVAMEARLRKAEKLEAVGRLAGGVAHDFNNLLTVIRGHAELLDVTGQDDTAYDNRASVDKIIDAAEMAASLTRELLTFSREDARSPQPIILDDQVRRVCKVLDRLLPSDVTVDVSLSLDGVAVELNPVHAEQVVLNLALNARDAMRVAGGTLTIRTNVEAPPSGIAGHCPGLAPHCVHLEVSDTGEGMVPETMARIFDPYFTTKGMGSGLGLATVYGVVEDAGGAIEVHSLPGRGTAFHVYLPVTEAAPGREDDEVDEPATSVMGSETILVADDTDEVRRLVARVLAEEGYDVISASNGSEALSLVAALGRPIDLLLTDVMMPVMKGPELYNRLKALCPTVPVLFMSGYHEGLSVTRTADGEERAFIHKPFGSGELVAKVRGVLDEASAAFDAGASVRVPVLDRQ